MAKFLLSVNHDYSAPLFPEGTDIDKMMADVGVFNREIADAGELVFVGGLFDPETAAWVSVADGMTKVTEGPFAEARQRLGGFWVVEVADRDAAIALAVRATVACGSPIEVRPFNEG